VAAAVMEIVAVAVVAVVAGASLAGSFLRAFL
jgi:hypothetical protein